LAVLKKEKLEVILRGLSRIFPGVYHGLYHEPGPFVPGESRINYAGRVWNEEEVFNLIDSALDFWLTAGRFEREFSRKLANFLGVRHVITANSGSSANLLAISALTSHKLGDRRLRYGDEVVTVAAGFPTTVVPIVHNGLIPVFVDIELGTYNIDPDLLEEAVSERTRAIFLAHTLGIPFDVGKVVEVARKHNLWIVEDNCDALGARWDGKYTGTIGDMATLSFYPAHHITMGEGGAVVTSNAMLKKIVLSFRDWGRDCWCDPGRDNTCGKRFGWKLGSLPEGYDHKYIYSHLGYNLKITDMQAAVGLAQLDKLPDFMEKRRSNWMKLHDELKEFDNFFILPRFPEKSEICPFGFALTIREDAPFERKEITGFLEDRKIQTRTIFAGNIARQPAFQSNDVKYRVVGDLENTDRLMMDTFWVGVYPGMSEEVLEYVIDSFRSFLKQR
jgi:CDP-6-deoxy-D-xylo-4-hexulose-3-dehydrase